MNTSFHYYCPICGSSQFPTNTMCVKCKQPISLVQSLHDAEYYQNKSMELYGDYIHWHDILISEEVSKNPLFDVNINNRRLSSEEHQAILDNIFLNLSQQTNTNIPKCPTCQSTNIKRISTTQKSIHGFDFGLFSKTAHSQFECCTCGYKW